ncbi:FecR domain-containing protein [Methylophaga sp.]|uniref:FecR domain-containing protein n=1 Tax=Methylophaga sp. TaxID=2024840 RepID=UPI0027243C0C|nr:FecR family protein [Methylophaga sp.]MDO8826162.1 FecR family protein [Methylophaga sp.]
MDKSVTLSAQTQAEPAHHVMEQAAEWYALLSSDEATQADHANWTAWLARSPEHRLAWSYVERVSRHFEPMQSVSDPRRAADGLWEANSRVIKRRQVLGCLAALAGTGMLSWITMRHTPLPLMAQTWRADYHTATGESREVVLSDGTRVWLNTASAFNQNYTTDKRHLNLLMGEILIDTASDALRPFIVETPQGRLRALGTRFTVRLDNTETYLAVYDGMVEAQNHSGEQRIVKSGEQLRFTPKTLNNIDTADPAREAWSRGMLVAQDISLHEVVKELRRYRKGHLGVAPEVADLLVFGNFPLTNTDTTLEMLTNVLPIQINYRLPWWVTIEAKS